MKSQLDVAAATAKEHGTKIRFKSTCRVFSYPGHFQPPPTEGKRNEHERIGHRIIQANNEPAEDLRVVMVHGDTNPGWTWIGEMGNPVPESLGVSVG